MKKVLFLSEGKMGITGENQDYVWLTSQALERHKKSVREIENRNKWKKAGSGAQFMGGMPEYMSEETTGSVGGVSWLDERGIIYVSNHSNGFGLHIKDVLDEQAEEGHIIRQNDIYLSTIDFEKQTQKIAASISYGGIERYIALFDKNKTDYHVLTEGDCIDQNPCWDKENPNILYYDSAGLAKHQNGFVSGVGNRGIYKLDIEKGEITDLLEDVQYDFIKPKVDQAGCLYCIRKPYKIENRPKDGMKDALLFLPRLIRAIFAWLNFFSQRYTGESLKAGGGPEKMKEKSEEEIFIEGNLVRAEKTIEENRRKGERYPGMIPSSWELIKLDGDRQLSIKQGVLDFDIDDEGMIYYSNGKHVLRLDRDGKVESVCSVNMAESLHV